MQNLKKAVGGFEIDDLRFAIYNFVLTGIAGFRGAFWEYGSLISDFVFEERRWGLWGVENA